MDTSIRLYNTNNSLRPVRDAERKDYPPSPVTAGERQDGCGETATAFLHTLSPAGQGTEAGASSLAHEAREEETVDTHPQLSVPALAEPVLKVEVTDFEAIFLRFQGPITNFIFHLIGNREQAYDLAQDVFVKAYKALLNGTVVQPGALSAWLYRIAANTTTDTLRRRRLIAWLPLSLFNEDRGIGAGVLSDAGGTASDGFSNNEEDGGRLGNGSSMYERGSYDGGRFENRVADREIVERVLKQLPPKYAVCLWLYENDGLSCAEIAKILDISASAVKMRLMRARERFINLYKQEVSEA